LNTQTAPTSKSGSTRGLPEIGLILFSALFILLSGNLAYFGKVIEVYPWNASNALFLLSLFAVCVCTLTLITALFSLLIPLRALLGFMFLLTAITAYFADSFGTIIDAEMIRNVMETDVSEAADLLNIHFIGRLLLLGILPAVAVWFVPLCKKSVLSRSRSHLLTAVASILLAAVLVVPLGDQYASLVREHKAFRYYANPTFPLYSVVKLIRESAGTNQPEELHVVSAKAEIEPNDTDRELVIVVVGETARRDHFSLNGYSLRTNPLLEKEPRIFSYDNVQSCGTSTSVSVPCMFALHGRTQFDHDEDANTENALDLLQRAGVNVLWRDNNSNSKGVANRVQFEDFRTPDVNPVCDQECRDVGMLDGLQDYIDTHSGDILIVLHQMGNHGPAYFKRYPSEFEKFKPACHSAELSECTLDEITNAYDNAILYTDFFLAEVIDLLKTNTPAFETSMMYVSDHGESLGEDGFYLHGMPYLLAPPEQTDVPVILWLGQSSGIDLNSVLDRQHMAYSHDAVFQSLLSLFEMQTDLVSAPRPLFEVTWHPSGGL
jgi:lipid A ethanolaminephosphotransferase